MTNEQVSEIVAQASKHTAIESRIAAIEAKGLSVHNAEHRSDGTSRMDVEDSAGKRWGVTMEPLVVIEG